MEKPEVSSCDSSHHILAKMTKIIGNTQAHFWWILNKVLGKEDIHMHKTKTRS
jgi:hypothetical protein